jgi:hypothetical protein
VSAGQCAVGEKTLRLYAFVKHFKAHGGDSNMESLSLKRLKTGMAYSMRVSLQDIYETCVDKTSDETKRFTDGRCYENRCNHLSCSPIRLRRQRLHSISFRFCQGWRSVYSEFPDTHYPLKSVNNHKPFHMHLDFQLRV